MKERQYSKPMKYFKYTYLIFFFVFLAGVFAPISNNTDFAPVIFGVGLLILGFLGGLAIHRVVTSEEHQIVYFGVGVTFLVVCFIGMNVLITL